MRNTVVAAVGAVWVAGCGETYSGRLVDEDGRPVTGWTCSASVNCRNVSYPGGISGELHTFDCYVGSDGRFIVSVPDDLCDTAGVLIGLANPDQPGQGIGVYVSPPIRSMILPDLHVWSPAVTVTPGADAVAVAWTPVVASTGLEVSYSLLAAGLGSRTSTDGVGMSLDRRLLQDWTFNGFLSALGYDEAAGIFVTWNDASPVTLAGERTPLSRGGACSAIGEGVRVDFAPGECPVTSGSVGDAIDATMVAPGIDEIVVDLGAVTSFGGVTLHGAFGGGDFGDLPYLSGAGGGGTPATGAVEVEGSDDCVSFSPIAAVSPSGAIANDPIAAPGSARCVRLRFGGTVSSLDEVGVW